MIKLTPQEIEVLHSSNRIEFFKAVLVDKNGIEKCDLDVVKGEISYSADRDIQKIGTISYRLPDILKKNEDDGSIYSLKTDTGKNVFYHNERVMVDFLNDRVNIRYGVEVNSKIMWWDKGLYVQVKPTKFNGIVSTALYDESLILKRSRILDDKVFAAGTNYVDVLQYFIIYCGIIKIRIEATNLALRTDVVVDSKKSCLEWFNYFAAQINYTNLYVDGMGWFVSDKYKEPSPSMVGYVYEANELSVIGGDLNSIIDNTNVPNVFRRTVSHPILGELTSTYVNDDPTDKYSTVRTSMNYSDETIDNIASQEELDNYTRKEAWRAKQITEEITFSTLNMPHHESNEILELRHPEAEGIVVESSWNMQLKSGTMMLHKAKRLVSLNDD